MLEFENSIQYIYLSRYIVLLMTYVVFDDTPHTKTESVNIKERAKLFLVEVSR